MGKHTATDTTASTATKLRSAPSASHAQRPRAEARLESSDKSALTIGPRHALPAKRATAVWRTIGLILLSLALMGTAAVTTLYMRLQSNIDQFSILRAGGSAPASVVPLDQKAGQPLNILLLGSDARPTGSETVGMRSDTVMLMHISADRSRVDIISIPRDTLVDIPACRMPDGSESTPESDAMFNSAFSIGGSTGNVGAAASCTLATVEQMGDIFIDGFAVVDFQSFQAVVDSIGGVEMCFREDISDPDAALDISAGCHNLTGNQALGIARARHSLGDGSDISRIGRQQELVFSIADKLLSKNIFTDTQTFYQVASDVTQNLSTSAGLGDLRVLAGLAYSLRGLNAGNGLNLLTLPVMPDMNDPNRVRATESAGDVWDAIRYDRPIPASALNPPPEQTEVVVQNRQPKNGDSDSFTDDSDTASNFDGDSE
ncbi:MAG: LCP family protein [Actinomycetaceae bacterium]|nr:LCP family protein [Actinomycetaceae bacterium]MDY5855204.1 LCP family protein [Arcanobacterium sp.]